MTTQEFQEIVDKHTLDNTDIYFKMNSLIGELGELANIFKKERTMVPLFLVPLFVPF